MNAIQPRTPTARGRIAPLLYGEPARVDELLRQMGRLWAESIDVGFLEYDQADNGHTVFAMHLPRSIDESRCVGVLSFGPSQPTEPLNPMTTINIDATCYAPSTDEAMGLCMSFLRLVQPSGERGGFGPFVHSPRLSEMRSVPGVPVNMADLWPVTDDVGQWHGWRTTTINVASPPQLIGRTGHTNGGRAEATMSIQCLCDAVTIDAPPATVQITSTNASSSVEVRAAPRVGSDGLPDSIEEYLHLRWADGDGDMQSAVIDFDSPPLTGPTIAQLKALVEANAGWTLTIDDPPGGVGGALGIADRFARHLYSTDRTTVTDTTPAMLRVAASE